jgi:hypothetical protein
LTAIVAALLASDVVVETTVKRKQSDDMVRIGVTALFGLVRRQYVITALTWGQGGLKVIWRMEKGSGSGSGSPPPSEPGAADAAPSASGAAPSGSPQADTARTEAAQAGTDRPVAPGSARDQAMPPGLARSDWNGDSVRTDPAQPGAGADKTDLAARRQARPDPQSHSTVTIDMKKMKKSYRKFMAMLKATWEMKEWMAGTARHVRCPELVWVTRIGLGDAAESAVAAGVVWGIKAPLVGWFTRFIRMQRLPQLAVVPLFNEVYFETEFSGSFRIRLGSLLAAIIRLVWRVLRVPGGLRRWRKVFGDKREQNRRKRRAAKERLAGEA